MTDKGNCNDLWVTGEYLTVILDQATFKTGVYITGFKDIQIGERYYRMYWKKQKAWGADSNGNLLQTHYWSQDTAHLGWMQLWYPEQYKDHIRITEYTIL